MPSAIASHAETGQQLVDHLHLGAHAGGVAEAIDLGRDCIEHIGGPGERIRITGGHDRKLALGCPRRAA
jgi:hypothetical protein